MTTNPTRVAAFTRTAQSDDAEPAWFLGDLYTYLLTSAESAGGPCVIVATCRAGSGPPEHVHEHEDELVFVLSGSATFYLDGEPQPVGAGAFVWLPRGQRHTFVFHETSRVLLVLTPGAGMEGVFRSFSEPAEARELPPADVPMPDFELVVRRFGEIGTSMVGPPPDANPESLSTADA